MINPWEVKDTPWKNESQYWNWVRSVLRKGWSRHPVKVQFVKDNRKRVPNPNPNGRGDSWGMTCNICKGDFILPVAKALRDKLEKHSGEKLSTIEINHKKEAGSLTCKEDLGRFASNLLFINYEDLEPLCQTCHAIVSYSQKHNITFEEARLAKRVIEIINSKKVNEFLEERGIEPASNAKKRRLQITEYLQENL
tara:strand:- start:1132 stop:1716 length:585 start_codon:yes stop_codon:yes gene_type:complete